MPRLSSAASEAIRYSFAPWLERTLAETGVTLSGLAYPTRPHVANEGTEISYSNLKKFAAGESAPSESTVLRILQLLAATGRMKASMLSGLWASYPNALARVVTGLDVIGLDTYWKIRKSQPQLKRQLARMRFQESIGLRGYRALKAANKGRRRTARFRITPGIMKWLRDLTSHCDLLAITVAYAFCDKAYGDSTSMDLMVALSQFDAKRESLYWEALMRYGDFDPLNAMFAGPDLYRAEQVLGQHATPLADRLALSSDLYSRWASQHAYEFINAVPLLDWVESDTIRSNLSR